MIIWNLLHRGKQEFKAQAGKAQLNPCEKLFHIIPNNWYVPKVGTIGIFCHYLELENPRKSQIILLKI